jgi:cation-transporting ATPase E
MIITVLREYISIIQRNVVTPIVIAMAVLITALLLLGELRDAFFISIVITLNVLIAIIQEIRAHHALRKLEIMNAPRAHRLATSGDYEIIAVEAIRLGDTLKVGAGDQIPADGKIIHSQGLECNEAMLTGEARTIVKDKDATVYAGSVAMAGSATMTVVVAGDQTKAGKMTATLKRYKPELTPLQKTISRAIQGLTYGALAITLLIIVVYTARGVDVITIVKTVTTAGIVLVPEGLLLASTLLLAFGAINLARNKVLPQKLSAIEAMALLDVLCVDKTGTLTSDVIQFEKLETFTGETVKRLEAQVAILAREAASGNATGEALSRTLPDSNDYSVEDILAFSSDRKLSAVRLKKANVTTVLMMGAPEVLAAYAPLSNAQQKRIEQYVSEGLRVLLLVRLEQHKGKLRDIKPSQKGAVAGLVLLSNKLREGVVDTVEFLQKRGVSLRVISGDNPKTVQYVAAAAGIKNAHKVITGAELERLSDKAWDSTVLKAIIFARVLPEHKKRLIATFKKHGNFTGMVGDGVNDALALKEANLGVAMFAGAAATRRVADIILLDNSFTSLPIGMKLGNKIMQAIELIASLFFHKIIYGLVLLFITLALNMLYPFLPRHLTFMNVFLVGLPTILWTLFPPVAPERVNPREFWRRTLGRVAPVAILTGSAVAFTYWWLLRSVPAGDHEAHLTVSTMIVLVATLFGVITVFLVPRMLNVPYSSRTWRMRAMYVLGVVLIMGIGFGLSPVRHFFDFTMPATHDMLVPALVILVTIILQWLLVARAQRR